MSLVWSAKPDEVHARPRVLVIADAPESGEWLVREIFMPHGLAAEVARPDSPPADVIVVDITQLQGMALTMLRARRDRGDQSPAIILAARLSPEAGRDLFRLGVRDFLLKPYRPEALIDSIMSVQRDAIVQQSARQALPKLKLAADQLRKQNEEYRILLEVSRVLLQSHEVDAILRQVVEATAFLTHAEDASLYLIDSASNEVFLRASKEAPETRALLHHQLVSDMFVSQVVRTGQPLVRQPSPGEGRLRVKTAYMVQALINMPIFIESHVGGVLAIYNRSAGQGFGEHQLIIVRALAHTASLALTRLKPAARPPQPEGAAQAPPKPMGVVGEVLGPEFRQALQVLATETDSLLRIAPRSPYRDNLARLSAVVQPLLKLMPSEPSAAPVPRGSEQFSLPRVVDEALKAVRPVAELRHIGIIPQLAGEFPPVFGNPKLALTGMQTLLGWAIARSSGEPVALAVFHMRSGEPSGPFTMTQAEGLPPGEWVTLSLLDSGPRLSSSELGELGEEAASRPTVSPLGAACRQVRDAGGHVWLETAIDGVTLYAAFRAV